MSNVRSIAKNFIALGLAQILSTGLSLVLVIVVTRVLNEDGYGKLGFAIAMAGILTVFTPLGLDQILIREVARRREAAARYLGNILTIELLLSFLSSAIIVLVARLMNLTAD
jgi:O-antigen/teichoic acid export membrane protein